MLDYCGTGGRSTIGKYIDAVGWMAFVAWVGVVFLLNPFPPGVGSLGIGGIVLLVSTARRIFGGSISNFWLVIGGVFILAGVGELVGIDLPFLSMALIICGALMLCHNRATKR